MAARSEKGIARVLDKLEASINSGQYYEAHQMYRTLYFRYSAQKKYSDLLNLLYKGSLLLLQRNQQGSGADLAILFIEILVKSNTKPSEEWIDQIGNLFALMSSSIPERELYLTNSVKWSMDSNKKGHPLLHKKIAETYWKEKQYTSAHKHFLHSNDGAAYAKMLVELHETKGMKSEIDIFIAQAVFQILCLRNIQMAKDALKNYTLLHPKIKKEQGPYQLPLLNFLSLLLRTIEQRQIKQFVILKDWYSVCINRDPFFVSYLENIGRIYFNIEVPQNRNRGSMFGGLLKSIMGEDDSSDDDGESTKRNGPAPDLD